MQTRKQIFWINFCVILLFSITSKAFSMDVPVASWSFNEKSGKVVLDSSGNNNHGDIYGAKWHYGFNSSALYFYSGDYDEDYIEATAPAQLTGDCSFTVEFWMKMMHGFSTSRAWIMDIGNRNNPNYTTIRWLINADGMAEFGFWGGVQNQFNLSDYRKYWILITTTYDKEAGLLRTYLNGNLKDEVSVPGDTVNLQPNKVYMGLQFEGESNFRGILDEVKIYDTALEESAIMKRYNRRVTSLVSHWSFNDAYDYGVYYNTATVSGATWTSDAKFGKAAYSFDGVNDYINCGNDISLNLDKESFSFALWAKFDDLSSSKGLVGKHNFFLENQSLHIVMNNSTSLRFGFYDNDLIADGPFYTGAW